MSAPQQSHCKVVVRRIFPKQTTVSTIGKPREVEIYIAMYITFTVVKVLIVILVTFLNGNATAILKKKNRPKLPFFLYKK